MGLSRKKENFDLELLWSKSICEISSQGKGEKGKEKIEISSFILPHIRGLDMMVSPYFILGPIIGNKSPSHSLI